MLADVYSVHNPGANEDLAPTTPASKRPAEDCECPPAKYRALSELRDEDTPPGFRIASNGHLIPGLMHTPSHGAERECVDVRVVWGPDDMASTVSSSDPDAVPGTPPEPEEDPRKVARRERRIARVQRNCSGCRDGISNQDGHTHCGGCMDPERESVDSDVSSDDEESDGDESDDESEDEDGEDGPGGRTVLVPETPPASPSPRSPGSPGIVVPESPLN